jgi:hypothetical protein
MQMRNINRLAICIFFLLVAACSDLIQSRNHVLNLTSGVLALSFDGQTTHLAPYQIAPIDSSSQELRLSISAAESQIITNPADCYGLNQLVLVMGTKYQLTSHCIQVGERGASVFDLHYDQDSDKKFLRVDKEKSQNANGNSIIINSSRYAYVATIPESLFSSGVSFQIAPSSVLVKDLSHRHALSSTEISIQRSDKFNVSVSAVTGRCPSSWQVRKAWHVIYITEAGDAMYCSAF